MQESQPEFFEFLRKNDPNLLNFANGGDSDSDSGGEGDAGVGEADDGSASEDEAGSDGDEAGAGQQAKQTVLSSKLLGRLMQRAFDEKKGSWRGVVKVLQAFRAACHLGDEAADAKQGRKGSGTPEFKYRILRGDVFNDTITGVLEHLNAALQKQVKRPAAKKGRPGESATRVPRCVRGGGAWQSVALTCNMWCVPQLPATSSRPSAVDGSAPSPQCGRSTLDSSVRSLPYPDTVRA